MQDGMDEESSGGFFVEANAIIADTEAEFARVPSPPVPIAFSELV